MRPSVPCSREAVQAELDRTQDQTGSGEETENGRNIKITVSKSVSLYFVLISGRLFFAVKSERPC